MAPIMGKDGKVKTSNGDVGYIDSWNLSWTANTAETSAYGSRAQEFKNTTIGASGSASGTLDPADASQSALIDMFTSGGTLSKVQLDLVYQTGGTTDGSYSGEAVITGIEIGSSHSDKVTFSFNFQISGEINHTAYVA